MRNKVLLPLVCVLALFMASCSSSRVAEYRNIRDSVVYTYKTVYHDSLRVKDSVRLVVKTHIRDSVVLKIDNVTGKVISRESWHVVGRDSSMDHVADVRKMANRDDSTNAVALKSSERVIYRPNKNNTAGVWERVYWVVWPLSVGVSVALILWCRGKANEWW